jgi:hypothetical protein
VDAVEALIAAGADVGAKDIEGKTAMWFAKNQRIEALVCPIREVICVSGPHMSTMFVVFRDGTRKDFSHHTGMGFGYAGGGPGRFSAFLREAGFAFTDASLFVAPRKYRFDGTSMGGIKTGNEVLWEDGTKTLV